jgi:integrase
MRFTTAIDEYVRDQYATGRFNSAITEQGYRYSLGCHAEDVDNRDPRTTNREDVKRTLARWATANTRATYHSHLISFYDWAMEEGVRKDNPARQVRRTKVRKPSIYRLTRDEVRAFRDAAVTDRERTVADMGLLAGLRSKEILGLQGRHFRRPGWVWVSSDIAKGSKARWVRVLPELEDTWGRLAALPDDHFAVPRREWIMHGRSGHTERFFPLEPAGYDALHRMVGQVGKRAGIAAAVTPHMLRHAYGDHVARFAGIEVARALLGHESIKTTQRYTGGSSLDEIAQAMEGFGYGTGGLPPDDRAATPLHVLSERVYPESGVWPGERDWDLGGFPYTLTWLRSLPGFKAAVREMGAHA